MVKISLFGFVAQDFVDRDVEEASVGDSMPFALPILTLWKGVQGPGRCCLERSQAKPNPRNLGKQTSVDNYSFPLLTTPAISNLDSPPNK